jgi:NADP-dependent aldehyde dehydrogenase
MSELSAVRTSLTGEMLIGGTAVQGDTGEWRAVNPATGECLLPVYRGGSDVAALEWRIG